MTSWHTCKTVHCEAGWIVFLAGEEGRQLEELTDTPTAAGLILRKSSPKTPRPNFYATDEQAMAFINARVKEEAAAKA